ncbi:MAG TPA: Holliday junction resolvase RuvX [Coxiellaceae bacterium]|nr:MAG: Holliday junction DNA helicase RuvA [Gammaproteobacteria bacterium RIFCSPHIGHO2_12_FULL_36_30]HLB55835.1 Holliday junction resolvase RuvX [Coxiellaceae bacterium]
MHHIILGFDFGLKRIGVAVGQTTTRSANPLTILKADRGVPHWDEIKKLITEWGADTLIVGLPLNMDGTEQFITQQAKIFGEELKKHFKLPVIFVDERLTTIAAKDEIHSTRKGAARFERADSVSAKLILESWLTVNG